VARGDGCYGRILERLTRFHPLAIDDWLRSPLRDAERRDLAELIEARSRRRPGALGCPSSALQLAFVASSS
jgi:hypothetical protein